MLHAYLHTSSVQSSLSQSLPFPSSRLGHSSYSLKSRGLHFSLPKFNTGLYKICLLIDASFSIFSCIMIIVFVAFFYFFTFNFCCVLYTISLFSFVLKVQMSSLFIKGYLTLLDFLQQTLKLQSANEGMFSASVIHLCHNVSVIFSLKFLV